MDYQYPIDYDWSTDETIDVINFFQCIEKAYENGISKESIMKAYRRFKEIVPGKSDEKNIFDEFEETSGYSSYLIIKKVRQVGEGEIIKGS